jgi:penicillin-binding protein 2
MFLSDEKLYFNRAAALFLLLILSVFAADAHAQKKKPAQKTDKSKTEKQARDSKQSKNDSKQTKNSDKKPSKADLAKQAESKRQAEIRQREEAKRREEIRQREAARQRAIAEERRRREQAAREAAARRLAFERGLRSETVENIAGDNTEGEDLEIRRAAVGALGAHAGTVVVMEAQTGKILSIVNQDWGIRRGFKPCSTIKLVTGVAGLNESVIDSSGDLASRSFGMDLTDALAFSNNVYFQRAGVNFGNEKMIAYARVLGLGERTGINAENESAGKLPYGNSNPRIYSHGDDFEVTPLQLAVMVSALSNGGKIVVPQIPRARGEKTSFRGMLRRQINLPPRSLQGVLPGMIGAVNYGTARRSNGADLNVAGKTGSCIGQGSWVGLFASVAPAVNPKYSVVVITRGQSERGKYASAIAGKIYQALGARLNENRRDATLAEAPPEIFKPKPKINAQTAAMMDEADEDSDEAETVVKPTVKKANSSTSGANTTVFPPVMVNKETPKRSTVEKTGSSKPVGQAPPSFAPVVIKVKRKPEQTSEPSPLTRPRVVKTGSSSRVMK